MKLMRQFIDFFWLSGTDKEIVNNEIVLENILRIRYLTLISIPVNVVVIAMFGLKVGNIFGPVPNWDKEILILNIVIRSLFIILSIMVTWYSFRFPKTFKKVNIYFIIMLVMLLLGAAIIVETDEADSVVNRYLVICFALGLILLLRPLLSMLYYFSAYFIYFKLSIVNGNPDMPTPFQFDHLNATVICLLISFVVWYATLNRMKQKRLVVQTAARLELATRSGGIGIWDFDIVNNNLLWDNQVFELFGIGKNDIRDAAKVWSNGVHPLDLQRVEEECQMAIQGVMDYDTEFRVVWPNGSIHNLKAIATVIRDANKIPLHLIGTNRDITMEKKSVEEILKAKQEADAANKAKSTFLANMSHEIRTPLNAIIGFSQLMDRDMLLSGQLKEYANSINRAGEHLLTLINDILELSKVEAGKVVLNPTNFNLQLLLNDLNSIFKVRAESKHLKLIFETTPHLPRYIFADEGKLRQIYINLIENAIKFTDEGSVVVRTYSEKLKEGLSHLIVEIQDTGFGIEGNEMNKLFKIFEQTTVGIQKGSGSGLGLALSRELAIIMGGNISVKSEIGKGSTFTFSVEIEIGNDRTDKPGIPGHIIGIKNANKDFHVLVVDDNYENVRLTAKFLNLAGFETTEAINGSDAIAKFEESGADLILMDLNMPVMNGFEAVRLIRSMEIGKPTPIIAITAYSFEEDYGKIEAIDIQGYIRKPFPINELFGTIAKVLDIQYLYEDAPFLPIQAYPFDGATVAKDISDLPKGLILQLGEVIEVADLDKLVEIVGSFQTGNPDLARHILGKANNYEWDYLLRILKTHDPEGIEHENLG